MDQKLTENGPKTKKKSEKLRKVIKVIKVIKAGEGLKLRRSVWKLKSFAEMFRINMFFCQSGACWSRLKFRHKLWACFTKHPPLCGDNHSAAAAAANTAARFIPTSLRDIVQLPLF